MNKEYLGDGVYAQKSQFGEVVLTTENGITATNTIILEPAVLQSFINWLKQTYNLKKL